MPRGATANLKEFPIPEVIENFVLIKEVTNLKELLQKYFPHPAANNLTPFRDSVLIVLLLLEKFLLETPTRKIAVKSQVVTTMLNYYENKKRDHRGITKKINFLCKTQIIQGKKNKELTVQFIEELKKKQTKIPIPLSVVEKCDIRIFVTRLINLSEELQKAAFDKGLSCYVMCLDRLLLENFKKNVPEADFSDSLLSREGPRDKRLQKIFSDTPEKVTGNSRKRKRPEKVFEVILEELPPLCEKNDGLKRLRKEKALDQTSRLETETQQNILNFLENMDKSLGLISTPPQPPVKIGLADKADFDETFGNFLKIP